MRKSTTPRLIRVNPELHKAVKICSIGRDQTMLEFVEESRDLWLGGHHSFYEGVVGPKQIAFPTDEQKDKKMRIIAAEFPGGISVNEAYGSALLHCVRAVFREVDFSGLPQTIPESIEQLAGNAIYRLTQPHISTRG